MNDELRVKNNELGGKMKYRYRTDEEMKDSGVEELGNIPKEWEVLRLRNLGNISTSSVDKKIDENDKLIKLVNYVDIYNSKSKELYNNEEYMKVSAKEKQIEVCNLIKGDVLFTPSSETINDIGYSAVVMEDLENTLYSYHIVRLRFNRDIFLNFKKYMFWSKPFLSYLSSRATGTTRKTLSLNDFKDNLVIIPNIKEQEKIAKFLDEKTVQFDSIISKKEALIEKLEEAKKSLISEVVTGKVRVVKTDDGYELVERKKEEMKDSGVEWLGDIPMGWNVSKIKHISSINSNVLSENTDEEYEIKYIDIGSVTSDGRIIGLQEYKFKDAPSRARRIVNDKDILISTVRTYLKAITSIEKSDENLICSTGFAVLSPSENIDYKFLSYFIRGNKFIDEVVSRSVGVSYPAITSSEIANLEVIIPSLNEQVKIGNYIDNKINKLNSIISNTQNQIDKIKEAKQSLISDAVTGKIEILD